jgi:TRAP-type C4-dicarboxylate transport system substrate-binding protein
MFNGIVTGIADMGLSHTGYTRGRFPVTEVFDLPLGFPSGYVAAQVSNDFYKKFKPAEWDNVHVLYFATSGPLIIQTINKPVKTLEDLKVSQDQGYRINHGRCQSIGCCACPARNAGRI